MGVIDTYEHLSEDGLDVILIDSRKIYFSQKVDIGRFLIKETIFLFFRVLAIAMD